MVEISLVVVTVAGIGALAALWGQLETLLAPGESPDLVRARLLRGILSLVVPLIALLLVSSLRDRMSSLVENQFASVGTFRSAKIVWVTVMTMISLVLVIDIFVIINGLRDIHFDWSVE